MADKDYSLLIFTILRLALSLALSAAVTIRVKVFVQVRQSPFAQQITRTLATYQNKVEI